MTGSVGVLATENNPITPEENLPDTPARLNDQDDNWEVQRPKGGTLEDLGILGAYGNYGMSIRLPHTKTDYAGPGGYVKSVYFHSDATEISNPDPKATYLTSLAGHRSNQDALTVYLVFSEFLAHEQLKPYWGIYTSERFIIRSGEEVAQDKKKAMASISQAEQAGISISNKVEEDLIHGRKAQALIYRSQHGMTLKPAAVAAMSIQVKDPEDIQAQEALDVFLKVKNRFDIRLAMFPNRSLEEVLKERYGEKWEEKLQSWQEELKETEEMDSKVVVYTCKQTAGRRTTHNNNYLWHGRTGYTAIAPTVVVERKKDGSIDIPENRADRGNRWFKRVVAGSNNKLKEDSRSDSELEALLDELPARIREARFKAAGYSTLLDYLSQEITHAQVGWKDEPDYIQKFHKAARVGENLGDPDVVKAAITVASHDLKMLYLLTKIDRVGKERFSRGSSLYDLDTPGGIGHFFLHQKRTKNKLTSFDHIVDAQTRPTIRRALQLIGTTPEDFTIDTAQEAAAILRRTAISMQHAHQYNAAYEAAQPRHPIPEQIENAKVLREVSEAVAEIIAFADRLATSERFDTLILEEATADMLEKARKMAQELVKIHDDKGKRDPEAYGPRWIVYPGAIELVEQFVVRKRGALVAQEGEKILQTGQLNDVKGFIARIQEEADRGVINKTPVEERWPAIHALNAVNSIKRLRRVAFSDIEEALEHDLSRDDKHWPSALRLLKDVFLEFVGPSQSRSR